MAKSHSDKLSDRVRSCHNGNTTRIVLRADSKHGTLMKCGRNTISLPVYKNIEHEISSLKRTRRELAKEYFTLHAAVLDERRIDSSLFDKLAKDIIAADKKIDDLLAAKYSKDDGELDALQQEHEEMLAKESELLQRKSPHSRTLGRTIARHFKRKIDLHDALEEQKRKGFNEFVREGHGSVVKEEEDEEDAKDKPVQKERKKVVQKRSKVLTEEQASNVKKTIKDLLKEVYKFKDSEECRSRQRSKAYYMTKEEILQEIEKNQDLKKLMPSNYKNLTKEKLCEHFYKE